MLCRRVFGLRAGAFIPRRTLLKASSCSEGGLSESQENPPRRNLRKYTAYEDRQIASLRRDGYTWPQIAVALQRSQDSVRQHARRCPGSGNRILRTVGDSTYFWSGEDRRLLLELHEKGQTWLEISRHFPGRTISALIRQIEHIKYSKSSLRPLDPVVPKISRKSWSQEESELLMQARKTGATPEQLRTILPGRTLQAMSIKYLKMCRQMGRVPIASPGQRLWSSAQLTKLKSLKQQGQTSQEIATELRLTKFSVDHQWRMLKPRNKNPLAEPCDRHFWTEAEDNTLKILRQQGRSMSEIAAAMTPRTVSAVQGRWRKLAFGSRTQQSSLWRTRRRTRVTDLEKEAS